MTITENIPRVTVKSEPLTYTRGGPHSWFRDTALRILGMDDGVERRLKRHDLEMQVEDADYETRAANVTAGTGGDFAPPLWLIQDFASINRPGRPLANLIGSMPLPSGYASINVPRISAGTTEAIQATNNSAASSVDVTDAGLTSAVVTIAGIEDTSLQLLEQSPAPGLDAILLKDMTLDYDAQLGAQLFAGTGSNGQLLGLANVPGLTSVTYTSGTPAGTALFTSIGQLIAQVGDARKLAVRALFMRPARWAWLATQGDSQGRPLIAPTDSFENELSGTTDHLSVPVPVGRIIGVPVYLASAIAANLGAGTNQDGIFAILPDDLLLWEGSPRFDVFPEVLSGTLGVRFRLYNFVAFIPNRHAAGVGTINGTGLVVQSSY